MEGHPAFDSAYWRYLFQVDVRLAATEHREKSAIRSNAPVLVNKFQWQIQQWNMERRPGLSTCTMNPPYPVLRFWKVLSSEIAYVAESDAGERGKEKHVTHKIEVRFRQWRCRWTRKRETRHAQDWGSVSAMECSSSVPVPFRKGTSEQSADNQTYNR